MSKDSKLCFELQQVSFGGAIELTLLRCGIAAITLGDVTGDGDGCSDDRVGSGFCFSSRATFDDAQHLAAERDCLLPDFQVPQTSRHAGKDGDNLAVKWYPMRATVSESPPVARTEKKVRLARIPACDIFHKPFLSSPAA